MILSGARQSLAKNFLYQFIYQGLIFIIPLIVSPYLTRVIGKMGLGIYTYINSIAYYFIILANLGISRHGQRIISQKYGKEEELRKAFWSLLFLHFLISLLSAALYFIFVFTCVKDNKDIYIIEGIYVASAIFDITWFFWGMENFKSVAIKNTVIKIMECIFIFSCVHSSTDLWKYALISALSIFLGQVAMIPQACSIARPVRFSRTDLFQHMKPLLMFSISVIAVSMYTIFDKVLLGFMMTKDNVALYEYSNKIINIPKVVLSVIGTVMFPKACKMAELKEFEKQKKYIYLSFIITSFLGMASIFGIFAIADEFVIIYYGNQFAECGEIIKIFAPLIFIIGAGDIIRTQYLIPNKMDKEFNMCILMNAIINIVLSMSLIPLWGIYGAVIGTISAEIFGFIYQIKLSKTYIMYGEIVKSCFPFLIIGGIMYMIMNLLSEIVQKSVIGMMIKIFIGALVYLVGAFIWFLKNRRYFS